MPIITPKKKDAPVIIPNFMPILGQLRLICLSVNEPFTSYCGSKNVFPFLKQVV